MHVCTFLILASSTRFHKQISASTLMSPGHDPAHPCFSCLATRNHSQLLLLLSLLESFRRKLFISHSSKGRTSTFDVTGNSRGTRMQKPREDRQSGACLHAAHRILPSSCGVQTRSRRRQDMSQVFERCPADEAVLHMPQKPGEPHQAVQSLHCYPEHCSLLSYRQVLW